MAKQNRSDIDILLSALLLCSVVIGGLHHWSLGAEQKNDSKKGAVAKDAPPKEEPKTSESSEALENPLADASGSEILTEIQPLVLSESVEKLIKMVTGIPLKKMMPVLAYILANKEQALNRDDRIELIVGIAATYKKPEEQKSVLDLILDPKYLYLREGAPLLYIAAYGDYPQIIPVIKTWYAHKVEKQANHAMLCEELESRALDHAIEKKDLNALKAMAMHGVTMTKDHMGSLLNEAVRKKAGCDIIGFLLDQGTDINYVVNGYTPLLRAIENYDIEAVKKLVERGADINKIGSNDIGNPRQVANNALESAVRAKKKGDKDSVRAAQNAVDIEAYIIEHGAKD